MDKVKNFVKKHPDLVILTASCVVGGTLGTVYGRHLAKTIQGFQVVSGTHIVGEGVDHIVLHLRNGIDNVVPGVPM